MATGPSDSILVDVTDNIDAEIDRTRTDIRDMEHSLVVKRAHLRKLTDVRRAAGLPDRIPSGDARPVLRIARQQEGRNA